MKPMERKNEQLNETIDLAMIDQIIARLGRDAEALIPILQSIQDHYHYLPEAALRRVAELSDISPAAITGVATFYNKFRLFPVGRHLISVCHGTACHVKGAETIQAALRRHLAIEDDLDTSESGEFTIQKVACLGCCTLAPVMQIDGVTYGHLTPQNVTEAIDDFRQLAQRGVLSTTSLANEADKKGLAEIRIGLGSCCTAGGSAEVQKALEIALREFAAPAVIKPVSCVGACHQTPLVEVQFPGSPSAYYARVKASDARKIVQRHFTPSGIWRKVRTKLVDGFDAIYSDENWLPITRYALDTRDLAFTAFNDQQVRIATEHHGVLNPLDLEEYRENDGFVALEKALRKSTPMQVIETVKLSALRGRGGGGFPTGIKWEITRAADAVKKYLVCNGDEGDPGAFMDRMLLESFPFRVLEGMLIAGYAVGATEGICYVRAEYPLAVRRFRKAIEICQQNGLLGDHILATDFNFNVRIMEGAGAFVCGEETGLIASLEGRRGTPRLRPPYPALQGYHGLPTTINNVETLAIIPWILRHGAEQFRAIGTADASGTKVFSLTGKVKRGGLIEVPMGMTIRSIVEDIGGGVSEGKLKAVQIGGPSGGCIPASLADTPIDYHSLSEVGAIMGSGGLVVINDSDCMVDIARYFLQFTQHESCGHCTFCRIGTQRMLAILDRICQGNGRDGDLEKLEELAKLVKAGSICGLGRTAPNPILSTLRHFHTEYEAHLHGICPAGKCPALIRYQVSETCIGCTKCAQICPTSAITSQPFFQHEIDAGLCTRCDLCRQICPVSAITISSGVQNDNSDH